MEIAVEKFANLECLKKYHSNIYELFMEKKDQTVVAVRTVITREGSHACVINTDTGEVYLNSRYSPKREAKKWAEQFEFQNSDINIMMFGFGNGIFVRELLKNMPQNSRLIIYEPHGDIFHEILKLYDITDILSDKRIFLCIEGKEHFFFQNLLSEIVQWSNVPTQIHCIHPGYKKLYMEEYKEFQRIIREENEKAYINQNTVIHFAKKSIRNIIQNLHFIGESNYILDYSEKIPEEIPMIIVAAGPSLKKNVEELRGAKGKAIIVAVDTAVRFLDEKHIDYDWAITVDPNKPKEYMVNISSCKDTYLCTGFTGRNFKLSYG